MEHPDDHGSIANDRVKGRLKVTRAFGAGFLEQTLCRVGRTARLGQKGEAVLFLQPCESEYLQELLKHGVSLKDLSLLHVLDHAYPAKRRHHSEVLLMNLKQLAADAFRAYARAYATYRGELKRIFQVKRLHLGHIAKSFGLKDTPF